MNRFLLWDVDGTLVDSGSVGHVAFDAAMSAVLGRPVENPGVAFDGKTDPQIAREMLAALGVPAEELDISVRKTIRALGPETAKRRYLISERGGVLPGVRELLTAVHDSSASSTVLTGNIAVNALLKLDTFHLTRFLDLEVGAFGSDRSVRTELVGVALDRVDKKRNRIFEDDEVWVIGDTPHDFNVARTAGVQCLLVATGRSTVEELEVLGARATLADLSDTGRVLELLLGQ